MEIERKFLVGGDLPEGEHAPAPLLQGYLAVSDGIEVRVRVAGTAAFLTVKTLSKPGSFTREEFEYPIPVRDATLLLVMCRDRIVAKSRRIVRHAGMAWEVDEYSGANDGLATAEVELDAEDQLVELPPWIGAEVTQDARYSNRNLALRPFSTWSRATVESR